MRRHVAILGAGAWGTALARHLARKPDAPAVTLWARDPALACAIAATRVNARYLPGFDLPAEVVLASRLDELSDDISLIVVATPIASLPQVIEAAASRWSHVPLACVGKGFVARGPASYALPHEAIAEQWRAAVGVVSGPSFAEEVARGLPTALVVAATARALASEVAAALRTDTLRAYVSDDLVGVEVGGAVKNVLAIAAGACDGLGFGHNARAALITRGLAECSRLALSLGGRRETLMGLAGLGDLVLTCTGDLSRNRRVGLALAAGEPLAQVLSSLGHVAEGVTAARAVRALAQEHGVEMPICAAVHAVLYEGGSPRQAVADLLQREPATEF